MSERRPVSLFVVVLLLVAAGALLFMAVERLTADISPGTATASVAVAPGMTIHVAAMNGDVAAITKILAAAPKAIDQPLDAGEMAYRGMTPLMAAAKGGKPEVIGVLVKAGAKVDAAARDGKTALMFAVLWSDAPTVQALLDAGARADARTDENWTPLMFAAARGNNDTLTALLKAGANVDARNKWGQTALMAAALAGETEKIGMILAAKPRVDEADDSGMTAASHAAFSDAPAAVLDSLIKSGASLTIADRDGMTPLMKAASRGDIEKVKLLIAAGAPKDPKDSQGWTATEWASYRDDETGKAIADLLSAK